MLGPQFIIDRLISTARNPKLMLDLSILQVVRNSHEFNSPEYELLDRMVDRNCYWIESQGPRLENGMFLDSFREI